MLKYKVNAKNAKKEYTKLKIEQSIWGSKDNLCITVEGISVQQGEEISFSRVENDDISFYEERIVRKSIKGDSGKTLIYVDNFEEIKIEVGGAATAATHYDVSHTGNTKTYLYFFTKNKHFLYENRVYPKKESIALNYDPNIDDFNVKRCPGDYAVYNNLFLYKSTEVNSHNRYKFSGTSENKIDGEIIVYLNDTLKDYFKDKENGTNWAYNKENGKLYLTNCITPSLENGKDNRNLLLWDAEDLEVAKKLIENCPYLRYYTKDDRFIKEVGYDAEKGLKYAKRDNTEISKKQYSIILSNLIEEDFSTSLIQEELLTENYVERVKKESKNPIIDYEKQIFEPVYYNSSGEILDTAKKINFILNFRERNSTITESEEFYDTVDYGEWKIDPSKGWNNYKINKDGITGSTKTDLLGYLGFNDEDVYFRKKKLSKSFIRLSFYDTQDRATQSLLFTSTIFVKEGELYSNYIKNLKNDIMPDRKGYVFTEETDYRLDLSFNCKGKYSNEISEVGNYNSNYSSEGFYLYLFPSIIKENGLATIYMKVEFNHAKYGYTIPFVKVQNNGFPRINYVETKDGKEYVNTKALFDDMYIPINLKYDIENNKYTWGIKGNDSTITFHLCEPRINKYGEY